MRILNYDLTKVCRQRTGSVSKADTMREELMPKILIFKYL
jgi:hypothetical protein